MINAAYLMKWPPLDEPPRRQPTTWEAVKAEAWACLPYWAAIMIIVNHTGKAIGGLLILALL